MFDARDFEIRPNALHVMPRPASCSVANSNIVELGRALSIGDAHIIARPEWRTDGASAPCNRRRNQPNACVSCLAKAICLPVSNGCLQKASSGGGCTVIACTSGTSAVRRSAKAFARWRRSTPDRRDRAPDRNVFGFRKEGGVLAAHPRVRSR